MSIGGIFYGKINCWFRMVLNPDHLPLILGIEKGWFKEEALEIEMIEPENTSMHWKKSKIIQWILQLLNLFI